MQTDIHHDRDIRPQDLLRAIEDLQVISPIRGLLKTAIFISICSVFFAFAFSSQNVVVIALSMVACAFFYAGFAITTHDAIHHTFTGIPWLDEVLPRMISIPMLWSHGVYAEVHKIHHKMNGTNPDDPERCQFTEVEMNRYGALSRFYWRNQIFINIFVFGGFGFILKNLMSGVRFYKRSAGVRRQFWWDLALIIAGNTAIFALMFSFGLGLRYAIFFLVLERVLGAIMQLRTHIEHYGLWGKKDNFFETQIFASRNIQTTWLMSWFFNGLNWHSMHHAFPKIPFYNLKKAHDRIEAIYGTSNKPMNVEQGYFKTLWRMIKHPTFIPGTGKA